MWVARFKRIVSVCTALLTLLLSAGCSSHTEYPIDDIENAPATLQTAARIILTLPVSNTLSSQIELSPTLPPTTTPNPCGSEVCIFPGHFVFSPPIGASNNQVVEPSYPYGGTLNGDREPHHGVEFINASGTPVLAAGNGEVVYAGNDVNTLFGQMLFYYGNLVVIEHKIEGIAAPVYTLYGHLSKIQTTIGAQVQRGEIIGEVGRSGKALGSHLHFEVREGINDFLHTRNPELWLDPGAGNGILVGQIFNEANEVRRYPDISILPVDDPDAKPVTPIPYAVPSNNGDSIYNEVFASGPLPTGKYVLTFAPYSKIQTIEFEIQPGAVTRVTLQTDY